MDKIIVIDIEATCWDGPIPNGEESEIMEIGICLIDIASAKREEKRSIIVNLKNSELSEYCSELTTLTREQLEKGVSFEEACNILKNEYLAKNRAWASYGDYDKDKFEMQCKSRNIEYPFSLTHINIKNLFAVKNRLKNEVSMPEALKILNLPLEGIPHRGVCDAWNVALILIKTLF